ncbi:hypothetical protein [Corynebacterium doosanense]|uniref:Uncharacterized protein n=1 Tax=Corynebacterium doosanense CAU 212 = DSM 45436 TaxID=558173 RepID=A0A097IJP7_9CORY|nr:hypothetical protein [Corynebacterium doosanense]AIT62376.1 hypothetical protein CDOO_13375 [Corynebacterium doosanense CAU 212 = DSM 45436]
MLAEELASPVESSTPVEEAEPRLALSIDDLGGDPRSIPNDQRVRLIEHARELSNVDLLRAYYEASDALTRAEEREESCSPVIADQYLRKTFGLALIELKHLLTLPMAEGTAAAPNMATGDNDTPERDEQHHDNVHHEN